MSLTLLVPGFHAASEATRTDLAAGVPPFAGLTHRPDVAAPASWHAALLDALGLAEQPLPVANAFGHDTGRAMPDGVVLRADPIGLIPDRDSAIAQPAEALELSAAESAELARDLGAFLREDTLTLHAHDPARWYVSGDWLPAIHGPAPDAFAFEAPPAPLATAGDPSARRLRRLQGELEMLLHAHPVNEARRNTGRATVSGLYWWGATGALDAAGSAANTAIRHLYGDDAWLRSVGDTLSVPVSPLGDAAAAQQGVGLALDTTLRAHWLRGDARALVSARDALVERLIAPLLARREPLTLIAEHGRVWTASDPDRRGAGLLGRAQRASDRLRELWTGKTRRSARQ